MRGTDSAYRAAEAFGLAKPTTHISRHGAGLIHDTFVVAADGHGSRYILQRINQCVFADIAALMKNIERVVAHLEQRAIETGRDPHRSVIDLVRTPDGSTWVESDGQVWRMVRYVEGTKIVDRSPSFLQAQQIGQAFGRFLDDLTGFPASSLHAVVPGYRDTQQYLAQLWRAVERDPLNRAADARAEISFIQAHAGEAACIQTLQQNGALPVRTIHGDTKLNNVLLDRRTEEGVCVIDLDTVMAGSLLIDIGDCVREAWVGVQPHPTSADVDSLTQDDVQIFEAIVSGFLSSLAAPLTPAEIQHVVTAVRSITLELGARFLQDDLSGDVYFRTAAPRENLRRARDHFRLARRIRGREQDLTDIVHRCATAH